MAPNIKKGTIVQIANPYNLPAYKLQGSLGEPSAVYQGSSGHQELADEDNEPTLRVSTRARFTYELDRFDKNVMLIINNNITDSSRATWKEAFQRHKFEFTYIETNKNQENEIWQKIDQFFRRDFSNIGMVAVLTCFPTSVPGLTQVNRINEWDVLNYYLANQPATLDGKPKVFISETPEPSDLPHSTSLPSDTLLIQTQVDNLGRSMLVVLCSKLISMNGTHDMLDILSEVQHKATQDEVTTRPSPIKYLHTLTKDLLLENAQQLTDEQWKKEFESRVIADPNLFEVYMLSIIFRK